MRPYDVCLALDGGGGGDVDAGRGRTVAIPHCEIASGGDRDAEDGVLEERVCVIKWCTLPSTKDSRAGHVREAG
jgi:hypothetical protein